jgi:hypothetical protein
MQHGGSKGRLLVNGCRRNDHSMQGLVWRVRRCLNEDRQLVSLSAQEDARKALGFKK